MLLWGEKKKYQEFIRLQETAAVALFLFYIKKDPNKILNVHAQNDKTQTS